MGLQPWSPPAERSPGGPALIRRLKRQSRFSVFLREHRPEVLTAEFQAALATLNTASPKGRPPVPPGRLALATLLQAFTGLADEDVVEAARLDHRWQLVLDWWAVDEPPFEQGTLVHCWQRRWATNLERALIEGTVELAERAGPAGGSCGWRSTRARSGGWPGRGHAPGRRRARRPGRAGGRAASPARA